MAYDEEKAYDDLADALMTIYENECREKGCKKMVVEFVVNEYDSIEISIKY